MQTPSPSVLDATKSQPDAASGDNALKTLRTISLTAIGVAALFSYFFHIEYFPLFDLQAASSYVLAVAWLLAVLLIIMALLFLLPSVLVGTTLKTRKSAKSEQSLTATIIRWMGFGMLMLIALAAAVLACVSIKWQIEWGILITLVFGSLMSAFGTHFHIRKIKKKHGSPVAALWKKKSARKLLLQDQGIAMQSVLFQLMPLSMLLIVLGHASKIADDDYLAFLSIMAQCAMFIAFVGGVVLHVVFFPRYRKHWGIALCLTLILPILITAFSGANGMLPMTMARITKIGNIRAEKLVLSSKACDSIAPILGIDCDGKTASSIQLCNVHIMSRIGAETYLRIADRDAGSDGKFPVRRILLPTADIMSMQVNFDIRKLRLDDVDQDLGGRSSACDTTLTTLHGDSAFEFNDFTLSDSGKAQLLTFIQEIKNGARGIQEIKVTGHADQIGHTSRNTWLAERRAQEVKLFMDQRMKNLATKIVIHAFSQGSAQPLMKDCGKLGTLKERIKCEAPNRRVELEIVKKALPAPK